MVFNGLIFEAYYGLQSLYLQLTVSQALAVFTTKTQQIQRDASFCIPFLLPMCHSIPVAYLAETLT